MAASPPRQNANPAVSRRQAGPGARAAIAAIAFALAAAILARGISAPFQKDAEPQSAQWIADIVQNGDWLLPHDYYGFVDRKPPLFYWLSAIVAKASGGRVDETRARTVSLIAGAALAAEVMAWSAAAFGAGCGWVAFAFLLGMYGFASRAGTALTDMLMTCLIFSAYLVLMPRLDGSATWRRTAIAGILLGLAILTKGPVAIVLIGLAVFLYMLLIRANPFTLALRGWPWAMLAIAVAIAAAWYVPAFAAGRGSDLTGVFIDENFGHFMPASMGGTGEAARPVYYILMRLIGGALPLSLLLPALATALAGGGFTAQARRPVMFQLALALAVVLLFSAASAKRDDYILPALPPLAILFTALFTEVAKGPGLARYTSILRDAAAALIAIAIPAAIIGLLAFMRMGGGLGGFGLRLQSSDASYAAIFAYGLARMPLSFAIFTAAILTGAALALVALWRRRTLASGAGIAVICIATATLWTGVLRPAEARTRSLGAFAAEVKGRVGGAPLYVAFDDMEFSWYYGRGVPALPRSIARSGLSAGAKAYLVARPPELARLPPNVRRGLTSVIQSQVLGGGGPPALYEITGPAPDGGLNGGSEGSN
jgi:4-amino-4-deoxy-L-arabinose transferase-like glycosyltransferase